MRSFEFYHNVKEYLSRGEISGSFRKRERDDVRRTSANFIIKDSRLFYTGPSQKYMRLVIMSEEEKISALMECHERPGTGTHYGVRGTRDRVIAGYFWPTLIKDVTEWVRCCHRCQVNYPVKKVTPVFHSVKRRKTACNGANKRKDARPSGVTGILEGAAKLDHDYVAQPPAAALDEALDYIQDLEARLEKVSRPSSVVFSRYCASDEQIRFYTKFPSEEDFKTFWESVAPSASRLVYWTEAKRLADDAYLDPTASHVTPLIDELFMYCLRVAVGIKEQLIADMFSVSIATVSQVMITWANYLFLILSSKSIWLTREKVRSTMPLKFEKHYPNVRVILGYTEVALEAASTLTLQSGTFSTYKDRTTLRGLLGVAPSGSVTFISPLYTGCISDKGMTQISGILPLLEPGDDVMAEKGFLIQDLFDNIGVRLITPPFKHGAQVTKVEAERMQAIDCLTMTVQKVIARVKSFHIWDSPVPFPLIGIVNQIWHNCCVLANYMGPISLED